MIGSAELLDLLREEREQRPDLAKTLDLHLALVAARAEAAGPVEDGWLERARARLERGEPALRLAELDGSRETVTRLAEAVCRIAARHEPELSEAVGRVAAHIAGEADAEADPDLLGFVLSQALRPVLQAYAAAAGPLLDGQCWDRGDCPVCGGRPDFAALEGEAGERRLLCTRCDFEWAYRRLGCPFCGSNDSRSLGYFPTGEGAYRLYVCEECKGYLKTVDLRETWQTHPLPLERILTVGMDLAALQHGYRPSGSRFGYFGSP